MEIGKILKLVSQAKQRYIDEFDDWDNFEDFFPEDDCIIFDEEEYP